VQTDLGNLGGTMAGMSEAPVTIKDSIEGLETQVGFEMSVLLLVEWRLC
jgi:hypothetical protein